jgi:hypothetical protein
MPEVSQLTYHLANASENINNPSVKYFLISDVTQAIYHLVNAADKINNPLEYFFMPDVSQLAYHLPTPVIALTAH